MAVPVLVEQLLLYLVGFSDTLITGKFFGENELAAVTNASYLLWFVGFLLSIVSVGATALVARLTGGGDHAGANRICRQSITLAWIMGGAILCMGWPLAPGIASLMNLRGPAAESAVGFLRIILLVTPLLATTAAGIACLRGAGDTRTGMWIMIGVNAINITMSWTLARGLGPIPRIGFLGVATGTAIAEAFGGLAVFFVLAKGRSGLSLTLEGLAPRVHDIKRILRISLPAAGEGLTNGLCQLWFLGLINRLGATATAAHGVAIRCEALAFLAVTAFSVPAATLTGQGLGAGKPDLAKRSGLIAWGMGTAILTVLGVILYLAAGPMFAMFLGGSKPEVARLGVPVLRIVAFAIPAIATINILSAALRGAGDTKPPLAIVFVGYLLVRLPLAYGLMFPATGSSWGLRGAWLAMFADLYVRGFLVAGRYLQGGWKHTRV